MSNVKEGRRPWKEGEGGLGQVQEDCEEFCDGFTTHSTFFFFLVTTSVPSWHTGVP